MKRAESTKTIPVLMLTARGEESDRVRGLDTGADDFVVKPYSVKELLARARAMIRRSNPISSGEVVTYGDITVDSEQHKAFRDGKMIKLGPTEFRLLSVFISRPGRVWSRDQLLERVWPHDLDIEVRVVSEAAGHAGSRSGVVGGVYSGNTDAELLHRAIPFAIRLPCGGLLGGVVVAATRKPRPLPRPTRTRPPAEPSPRDRGPRDDQEALSARCVRRRAVGVS